MLPAKIIMFTTPCEQYADSGFTLPSSCGDRSFRMSDQDKPASIQTHQSIKPVYHVVQLHFSESMDLAVYFVRGR